MNEQEIRDYAKLMEELNLTGLEVGEGAGRIRLERTPAAVAYAAQPAPVQAPSETKAAENVAAAAGLIDITSPMIGVYYSAPAENEDPYVKVGDRIKKGDTLCIIEAMKLMNELPAEEDGVIKEICVKNGQVVDYGTVLFRIGR